VKLYIGAGGDDSTINNFDFGSGSDNVLVSGTFTNVTGNGGALRVGASAVVTNAYLVGGSGEIAYNSTAITALTVTGGTWVVRRKVTTLNVVQGAKVIYVPDDLVTDFSSTTINVNGGVLDHRRGAVPTINANGGVLDYSNATETFTPGGTSFVAVGSVIREGSGNVTLSNLTYPGAMQRTVAAPAPGAGGGLGAA
jgi:hypothetical protein